MADEEIATPTSEEVVAPETQDNGDANPTVPAENAGEGGEQQPEANPGEAEHKRKGGWQRKIERLEREIEGLRQQAYRPPAPPVAPRAEEKEPEPKDFDLGDGTYDLVALAKATARYEAKSVAKQLREQEAAERAQQTAKSEQQTVGEAYQSRTKAAIQAHDDHEEVVNDAYLALQKSFNQGHHAGAQAISDAFLRHEKGPELEYHFGQNPAELDRIAKLPPSVALVELGAVLASLAKPDAQAKDDGETPPPPTVSQAPKPPTPVKKAVAADTPRPDSVESDKISSADEWARLRRLQLKNRKK